MVDRKKTLSKYSKNFLLVSCTLILSLVTIEILLRFTLKPNYQLQIKEAINKYGFVSDDELKNRFITRYYSEPTVIPKVPHPYFGFVYSNKNEKLINKHGFYNHDYELKKISKKSLVIGIFGGSLAEDFYKYLVHPKNFNNIAPIKEALLSSNDRAQTKEDVVFINYSSDGYKQPQTFILSSFFSDQIDIAITIDGFNELELNSTNTQQHPPFYPLHANIFQSTNFFSGKLSYEIYQTRAQQYKTALWLKDSLFHESFLMGHLWVAYMNYLNRKVNDLSKTVRNDKFFHNPYRSDRLLPDKIAAEALVHEWQRFTKKQISLLSAEKKPSFHFIQPNQHLKDSKKLSKKEKDFFINEELKPWIDISYPILLESAKQLNQRGLSVYDLSKIFKNTKKTTYIDNCCHLNDYGNEVLLKEVFSRVIEKLRKEK